ncbi:MAG: O-antigen ligase family protein [Patescibacteria group bacterium]|nr:O-antigen ligase family protein [Patescibacteria group bacterium]
MEGKHKAQNHQKPEKSASSWPILSWGLFLLLFVGTILVVFGIPFGPIAITIAIILLVFAYRATYTTFYTAIFFSLFLGLTVSLDTGALNIGERAFGGSIDIFLGDVILMALITAWAVKVILLWFKRHDLNWRPVLPVWKSYAVLAFAHLVTILSSYGPDPVLVGKFVLRPVIFCYVAFIALPANLIRSERRLRAVFGVITLVGVLAAINAYFSLLSIEPYAWAVRRAHPIPMFGINAIGDNHNLLAELLMLAAPATLALAFLSKKTRMFKILIVLSSAQVLAGLLTFARSAWIVFIIQLGFLLITIWRPLIKKYLSVIIGLVIVMIPLALYQLQFSFSPTAESSNTTRWMLTEIAWTAFTEHPIIGSGAGTYIWRVGNASVFVMEFGAPLDAHGFIQKLIAEVGSFGLLSYVLVLIMAGRYAWSRMKDLNGKPLIVCYLLAASASGAVVYQLFNTAYWTSHLWLPIGLLLAASEMYHIREKRNQKENLFGIT